MHKLFEGWDPRLQILINKVDKALKWKVWTMEELDVWVKVFHKPHDSTCTGADIGRRNALHCWAMRAIQACRTWNKETW